MKQYSIDNLEIAWLGLDFKEGIAQGTVMQVTRNAPSFNMKPTGQGKSVRVYDPNRTGTVTILVDQESQLHQSLKGLANSERNPATRDKVGIMSVRDITSGETLTLINAYIKTIPDQARGTESQVFSWVWEFEDFDDVEVQNLGNTVGV